MVWHSHAAPPCITSIKQLGYYLQCTESVLFSACVLQTQEQLPLATTADDGSTVQTNKVRAVPAPGSFWLQQASTLAHSIPKPLTVHHSRCMLVYYGSAAPSYQARVDN
jgi:hypothetical protein